MDKSNQYIRMCEQAHEIQSQWSPRHGDFFVGENGKIRPWLIHVNNEQDMVKGIHVQFDNGMPKLTRYIWLPRLDQLMEMAQDPGRRFENTTQIFFDWAKSPYQLLAPPPQKIFNSLEKLWLCFLMHKKFTKQWDGEDWQSFTSLL
jgi:hypothetical protein